MSDFINGATSPDGWRFEVYSTEQNDVVRLTVFRTHNPEVVAYDGEVTVLDPLSVNTMFVCESVADQAIEVYNSSSVDNPSTD